MKYYGYIRKSYTPDTVMVITKPCNTREKAEAEFNKKVNQFSKAQRLEMWGKETGVMKDDNKDEIVIPVSYTGVLVDVV
ncbi:protein of unknown function [Ruminococcaceae bacterium BL-6]|nr:protein of unknown function [Ruminococcaceae bacterium BL-6]